jgi:polyisoprenoid-binding protein YceI
MSAKPLFVVTLPLIALALFPLAATAGEAPEGRWEGRVEIPDRSIEVVVELVSSDTGWQGEIELPGQTQFPLPLDTIEVGDQIVLGSSKLPGNGTFTGALSEDGLTFSGEFAQGEQTAPFSLALNTEVTPEITPPDPYLYSIDAGHSTVGFAVRHFTVSNVRGRFGRLEGAIRYNPEDLSASGVMVEIDAASIDTDHEQRDSHLKSADFLDVENHPAIVFESTRVEIGDEGFVLTGDLTMHGVTKEVSFPFTMVGPIKDPLGMMRMGIEGSVTVDRRDWGLEWNRTMETGGLFVGHKVKIELSAEATQR